MDSTIVMLASLFNYYYSMLSKLRDGNQKSIVRQKIIKQSLAVNAYP